MSPNPVASNPVTSNPVTSNKAQWVPRKRTPQKKPMFGTIRAWHWIASALCLVATLGFALTGITLNHASLVEATPVTVQNEQSIPEPILALLLERQSQILANGFQAEGPLPQVFKAWYQQQSFGSKLGATQAEWDEFELYVGLPRAGGDRWFRVDLETGVFYQEETKRGWIAYFNDLHKGRNTSGVWIGFLDILAIGMLIYAITGLLLLKRYAKNRKSTWPLVLAGLVIPFLILSVSAQANEQPVAELTITIPELKVAEYHRPYVAVWLANSRHQRVIDLSVLYDLKLADNEGEKWLKDLRQWWRRSGRTHNLPIDGVSGATKRPGTHQIHYPNLIKKLQELPEGDYFLNVEAVREVGGREHLILPITLPLLAHPEQPLIIEETGQHELGPVRLTLQIK